MFAKLITAVVVAIAVAAVLLGWRQERLEMMHEMTQMHRQMDTARQSVWDRQVRIARHLEPETLQAAIERSGLAVEPALPTGDPFRPGIYADRFAEAEHGTP